MECAAKTKTQGIWDTAGKKNAPTGSGRTFLRELLYHTNTYCQEYFCTFLKFFNPLFSVRSRPQ